MKNFSLYTEELNFEDNQGNESDNITVGSYDTEYFYLCPGAIEAFNNLMEYKDVDMHKVEQAAKHVDQALEVEAIALERGHSTKQDLEDYDEYASRAEDILDDLGDLDNHEHYLRDVHEPKLIDMLDIDSEINERDYEDDDQDEDEDEDEDDIDDMEESIEDDLPFELMTEDDPTLIDDIPNDTI